MAPSLITSRTNSSLAATSDTHDATPGEHLQVAPRPGRTRKGCGPSAVARAPALDVYVAVMDVESRHKGLGVPESVYSVRLERNETYCLVEEAEGRAASATRRLTHARGPFSVPRSHRGTGVGSRSVGQRVPCPPAGVFSYDDPPREQVLIRPPHH